MKRSLNHTDTGPQMQCRSNGLEARNFITRRKAQDRSDTWLRGRC
jgi:hypothetical protein